MRMTSRSNRCVVFARCAGRNWPSWLLLCLILLAAFVLRTSRLDNALLSVDESFTWQMSEHSLDEIIRRTAADTHPPLHYVLLKAWKTIFGPSVYASRMFSAILGVLAVMMVYIVCQQIGTDDVAESGIRNRFHWGAIFAALLMTCHMLQLNHGRLIRMYSLGVFLALLTSSLLWKALHDEKTCKRWWLGYGVATAAFCYTHPFAFLSVFAQTLFVSGYLGYEYWASSRRSSSHRVTGFVCSGAIALALFSPWIPVLYSQSRTVLRDFWIPDVTTKSIVRTVSRLLSGVNDMPTLGHYFVFHFFLLLVFYTIWKSTRAGYFSLLQATIPVLISILVSMTGGRSIFLERCLLFAQASLFVWLGITLFAIKKRHIRLVCAAAILAGTVHGSYSYVSHIPNEPHAMVKAAQFLKKEYRPADTVLASDVITLYQLRSYLVQEGLSSVDMLCAIDPFAEYHSHMLLRTAMAGHRFIDVDGMLPEDVSRVWATSTSLEWLERRGWTRKSEYLFESRGTHYRLILYVRAD